MWADSSHAIERLKILCGSMILNGDFQFMDFLSPTAVSGNCRRGGRRCLPGKSGVQIFMKAGLLEE